MQRRGFLVGLVVAVVVIAAGAVWWVKASGTRPAPPDVSRANAPAVRQAPNAPQKLAMPDAPFEAPAPKPTVAVAVGAEPTPDLPEGSEGWMAVNLDDVRKALPDNRYWKYSAPTKDPDLLKWRDEERARWNVQYGKVLSGNATEKEIRDYYDHRAQVAGDDVEFATYMIDHYGDKLPERDVNMLNLAVKLNSARLEEIPRKIEEALARKHKQDEARAAWQADQQAFGAGNAGNAAGGDSADQ